ncbi:MAG: hypothetical protein AAF678_04525 [Pseudomonadota bacterium]
MRRNLAIAATAICLAGTAQANSALLDGRSPDPLGELNALYAGICNWGEGIAIPYEVVNLSEDGTDDYLLTYDLPCRGQANAFTGIAGTARQLWVSQDDGGYLKVLDSNTRDLRIERRPAGTFVIVQHAGSYCMTADAAPCFLTFHYTDNSLIRADDAQQHPSLNARLAFEKAAQEETSND